MDRGVCIVAREGGQRSEQKNQSKGRAGQARKQLKGGSRQMIRIHGPY